MPLPTPLQTPSPACRAGLPSTPILDSSVDYRRRLVTVQPLLPDLSLGLVTELEERLLPAPRPGPQHLLSGLLHLLRVDGGLQGPGLLPLAGPLCTQRRGTFVFLKDLD